MNKGIILFFAIFIIILFYSCIGPLEGSEVIGPGGGYVFYDKKNYSDGWRYIESAPKDAGVLSGGIDMIINFALARKLAGEFSCGGYKDWRLPTDNEFELMAKYFLDKKMTINNYPPDRGGIQYHENKYYVTSDDNVYHYKPETTVNSEGEEITNLFVQGSGKYESDCKYIIHLIRCF